MDKKQAEELKQKLFNKKENGWNSKNEEEKNNIFEYAQGYMQYMNQSKTEREIIINSQKIAEQNGFQNIENCSKFFRIHLYTENRDQVDERIEFKMSINNKGEITHFLEMLVPGSKEENIFLECLEEVKRFVNKMKILSDGDSSQLIRIFNPYLSVARRGSMKDFYVMWLLFQTIDNHVIKTYRLQLLDDLERIFKLMKKMPKGKAEDFFMDNMIAFIEKYQEHAVAV